MEDIIIRRDGSASILGKGYWYEEQVLSLAEAWEIVNCYRPIGTETNEA